MQIFSINFRVMLTPVITMFAIIVAMPMAYLNNMWSETYNVDLCLVSYNLHFWQFIATTHHVVFILYLYIESDVYRK